MLFWSVITEAGSRKGEVVKVKNLEREFIVVGENVHATRVVLRRGKWVVTRKDGSEVIRYASAEGEERDLVIPEKIKTTKDYDEGRVKHLKIAIQKGMSEDPSEQEEGICYLRWVVGRQVRAGADFLDINVDEVSLNPSKQRQAMEWLVGKVEEMSSVPLSVDSSDGENIEAGLKACRRKSGRPLLNSASLERIAALDLVLKYDTEVIVTASGEEGMPDGSEQRVEFASRMVDAAVGKGIELSRIHVDCLVFPISVDRRFGLHYFDAVRAIREKYGSEIHITGGLSNVSFGLPKRKIINDVFINLAVEFGADGGIVDPVSSRLDGVFSIDWDIEAYRITRDMLLGGDEDCAQYLAAFRNKTLDAV